MQKDLFDELKELILNKGIKPEELTAELENYHNSDIADVLQQLEKEDRLRIYSIIGVKKASEIFEFYDDVEEYIAELDTDTAADILEEMDTNDAVDVLNELDDDDKSEIMDLMESESKNKVLKVDAYNDDVIGSYMSDNYIVIDSTQTIKGAMTALISQAGEHDNFNTIYVVDDKKQYLGAINLKDLIIARKDDPLDKLIMTSYPSFFDDELMSDCINKLKDYAEDSIPIINHKNEIVGAITGDIVIDATEEELSDDYAKLGGLKETEDLDEPVRTSIKKRIPWLVVLLFLGLVVSTVTGMFEGVIATLPVIVFFQSMILDMAGNVGTQSLAVTIRNISVEDKSGFKSVLKEIRIGFVNGIIISAISFCFVVIFLAIKQQAIVDGQGYNFYDSLRISGIIAGSLLVTMTLSSVVGTVFPILLNKMHVDPAVASGPFITTFNDIIAIVIYYGLTYLFFIIFL